LGLRQARFLKPNDLEIHSHTDHILHKQQTASLFDRSFANCSFLFGRQFTAIPIVHGSQKVQFSLKKTLQCLPALEFSNSGALEYSHGIVSHLTGGAHIFQTSLSVAVLDNSGFSKSPRLFRVIQLKRRAIEKPRLNHSKRRSQSPTQ
jgi:hypothetical protein